MALNRVVSGILREVWQKTDAQGPGALAVDTAIRVSARQLSSIQGLLVITPAAGVPVMSAALSVNATGHLRVTVTNAGAPGSTATWELDVTLNLSSQQARQVGIGYILAVAGGTVLGAGGAETLAQAYAAGANSADQRMQITDADGGGIVVDASVGPIAASINAFEVRQPASGSGVDGPAVLSRRGNGAAGVQFVFDRARGTYAAPTDVAGGNTLGEIDFYGLLGTSKQAAYVRSVVLDTAGGQLTTDLEFAALDADTLKGIMFLKFAAGARQVELNDDCNLCLGNAVPGANATQAVVLPNTAVAPAASVNLAHLYAKDFFGIAGNAALALFQEAAVVPAVGVADTFIPITVNGIAYYLHATTYAPG